MKFTEFDLHEEVLSGLKDMGFTEATPIQEQAIPLILKGHDLIACAQTGTGKTAAFLVPMIDILDGISGAHIKALVLCPTRELATQSDEACEGLAYHSYVRSFPVFGGNKGGEDFNRQKAAFQQGADIVIATPGRLLQHISLGYVDLSKLEFLVLDEADRMLDMGFISDIRRIITYCNAKRQSLLFSATMPPKIRELAQEILFEPLQISIAISKPAEGISQKAYCVYDNQKIALVQHLFKTANVDSVIIFASRKQSVDRITKALNELGLDARGMHSDRDQSEREEIVNAFKNKQFPIMVATDIMSRGIDIDQLSHVINYDVPGDPEDYVHRIGRTARRETTGEAITFITEDEMSNFARIEKMIEREVEKIALPEALGQGPEYDPTRRPSRGGFDRRGGGGGAKQRGGGGGNRGGNNRGGQGQGQNQNQGRNNSGRDNRQRQPQVQGNQQEGNPQSQPNLNQGPKQAPVQGPGRGPNPQNRSNQPRHQGQNQGQGQGQQNQGPRNNNNPQGGQNTDPNRKKKKKKPNSGEPKEFRNSQGEVIEKQPPRVFLASSDDVGLPVKKNNKNNHRKTGKKKDGSPAAPTYIAPGE